MGYRTADPTRYELLKDFARENRKNPTLAESVIWEHLRGEQLGVKFRRQYVVDDFIADFIALDKKLIIEIDGGYHTLPDQQVDDETRTRILKQLGYKIVRFTNDDVLYNTCDMVERLRDYLKNE